MRLAGVGGRLCVVCAAAQLTPAFCRRKMPPI